MRLLLMVKLMAALLCPSALAHVKMVTVKPDQLVTVKTALGIATIIQLPEAIQSVIIGDQSGFKVEYLDKAITIKPLRGSARTNLYLVTEKRRYNFRLLTERQDDAVYIMYVNEPHGREKIKWRKLAISVRTGGLTLAIDHVGVSQQGFVIVEGKLRSNESVALKPEQFWVVQNSKEKVINGLFMSSESVKRDQPLLFGFSLAKTDLEKDQPVHLEIRVTPKVTLVIPEGFIWR